MRDLLQDLFDFIDDDDVSESLKASDADGTGICTANLFSRILQDEYRQDSSVRSAEAANIVAVRETQSAHDDVRRMID